MRWRAVPMLVLVVLAVGMWIAVAAPASAAAPKAVPARAAHPSAVATPAPAPLHVPADPGAARARMLRAINSVDEGFLLGLPGASPRGPVAYVPPQPRAEGADAATLFLAATAGLLAAVAVGAIALAVALRPRPAPETPPARTTVALAPGTGAGERPRRTTRVTRDAFDRLPPLLQLALLDRAGAAPDALD